MVADDERVEVHADSHDDLLWIRRLISVVIQANRPLFIAFVDTHEIVFVKVNLLQNDHVCTLDCIVLVRVRLVVLLETVVQEKSVDEADPFKSLFDRFGGSFDLLFEVFDDVSAKFFAESGNQSWRDWACKSFEEIFGRYLSVGAERAENQHDVLELGRLQHLFFHQLKDSDCNSQESLRAF